MKITEETGKDPLKRFINPEIIEKAPDGFTDNIMSVISVESVPVMAKRKKVRSSIVPFTGVMIMVLLIAGATITGNSDKSPVLNSVSQFFQNIRLPEIKEVTLQGLIMPGLVVYISVGMFVLLLFDVGLGKIFHRRH
jgi:MFS superfamily sulfate permease-like transporter